MPMLENKMWIYTERPTGQVGAEHYRLQTEAIDTDALEPTQIVVEARYWSVDPYMRIQQSRFNTWEEPHPLGTVQKAGVVGEVIAKGREVKRVAIGDIVNVYTGWQLYGTCDAASAIVLDPELAPVSTALGVLGMPGRTAYFGLLEAGRPKRGETLVVSGAAGAVGSIVGQIGKIKGCRVVGTAGSDDKVGYLTESLGFDAAINYRQHPGLADMGAALDAACPDGIDIYFDNVGGTITDAVLQRINLRARVVICGQISQYSGGLDEPEPGPRFFHRILYTRATIQGILARDFTPRMPEMLAQMGPWVRDGKIKYSETIMSGFDNLPSALEGLFHGRNTGKLLVEKAQ